jgi:hypothetical protein
MRGQILIWNKAGKSWAPAIRHVTHRGLTCDAGHLEVATSRGNRHDNTDVGSAVRARRMILLSRHAATSGLQLSGRLCKLFKRKHSRRAHQVIDSCPPDASRARIDWLYTDPEVSARCHISARSIISRKSRSHIDRITGAPGHTWINAGAPSSTSAKPGAERCCVCVTVGYVMSAAMGFIG